MTEQQPDTIERTDEGLVNITERERRAGSPVVLRFLGDEIQTYLVGVPARDITAEMVDEYDLDVDALAATKFYERPKAPKAERATAPEPPPADDPAE